MPCGWEGNRRSVIQTLVLHGLRKGDEQPAYTLHGIDVKNVGKIIKNVKKRKKRYKNKKR